jgi:hypothetical protein
MIPAIAFSVLVLMGVASAQGPQQTRNAGFMSVWFSVWSIAVFALLHNVAHLWKSAFAGGPLKAGLMASAGFMTLFSIPFVLAEVFGLVVLVRGTSVFVVAILLMTVFLHLLFQYLLKAPTSAGRSVLDKIEGFKLFLGAVDGDRMNRVMPPEATPQVFEKYLPYALALDVEQAWAEKFSAVLGGAAQIPGSTSAGYSLLVFGRWLERTGSGRPRQLAERFILWRYFGIFVRARLGRRWRRRIRRRWWWRGRRLVIRPTVTTSGLLHDTGNCPRGSCLAQ